MQWCGEGKSDIDLMNCPNANLAGARLANTEAWFYGWASYKNAQACMSTNILSHASRVNLLHNNLQRYYSCNWYVSQPKHVVLNASVMPETEPKAIQAQHALYFCAHCQSGTTSMALLHWAGNEAQMQANALFYSVIPGIQAISAVTQHALHNVGSCICCGGDQCLHSL